MVRKINAVLDLAHVRRELADYYSHTGRPSINPQLMVRMLIVGYCFGIRSERRLCDEVHLNLAYRWFCGLGLDGKVPDHSTFTRNRYGRFQTSGILRSLFETIVSSCITKGLVSGDTFATDASVIRANAGKGNGVEPDEWNVEEIENPEVAVRGYLDTLDDTAFGKATDKVKKLVSKSDPAAQWTSSMGGKAFFAYSTNYLTDTKHAIIMDVEGSRAIRQAEVEATKRMIDRTEKSFNITPVKLAADTAYGSAPHLNWLVNDKGIEPHIPVFDKFKRTDGTFSRDDFRWDGEKEVYICPQGKELRTTGTIHGDDLLHYRTSIYGCKNCSLKQECCPKLPYRKVPRSLYEEARNVAREIAKSPEYEKSRHARKKIEMCFAHLKQVLGFCQLRLRGPTGVKQEFLLAAIAQNLRKLTKLSPNLQPE